MDATEIRSLMGAVAPVVGDYVREATEPLVQRNAELQSQIDELRAQEPIDVAREVAPLIQRAEAAEAHVAELAEKLAAIEIPSIEGLCNKAAVEAAIAPFAERLAEIEAREPIPGPKGEPGEKGAPGNDGFGLAGGFINRDGILVLTLANGETRELGQVVGRDGLPGIDGKDGVDGEDGVSGKDGASATLDDAAPLIERAVKDAVAELPPPEKGDPGPQGEPGRDGRDVGDIKVTQDGDTIEMSFTVGDTATVYEIELPRGEKGEVGERGADGLNGADGRSVTKTDIDQNGELSVTYSDGTVEKAGPVRGEKGDPGADGSDGRDGTDGLGFDDMDEVLDDDGRTVVRTYRRGEEVREFRHRFSVPVYRELYREGAAYEKDDMVTYGGSTWIALKDTKGKPEKSPDWKLCAKRGRDGKNG